MKKKHKRIWVFIGLKLAEVLGIVLFFPIGYLFYWGIFPKYDVGWIEQTFVGTVVLFMILVLLAGAGTLIYIIAISNWVWAGEIVKKKRV